MREPDLTILSMSVSRLEKVINNHKNKITTRRNKIQIRLKSARVT